MHLVVIGINHDTAHVELREQLRIPERQLPDALRSLRAHPAVHECLLLSTCNRTELYVCTSRSTDDAAIIEWLAMYCGIAAGVLSPHLYIKPGHLAAEHLFRVASGLDSMVLGEMQILGQIRVAYAAASEMDGAGPVLHALFQQAITVGKRARSETTISRGAFSVSSVAVRLAKSIFGELHGRTVLIIGASKMAELTMTHLVASGADSLLVTNRTLSSAEALAAQFGGQALLFAELGTALTQADIVISSTGSCDPIITRPMMVAIMRARRNRPLFFIDIAVPRDVDAAVGKLDNVFVYNIDDLRTAITSDHAQRHAETARVEAIIREEVTAFMQRLRVIDAVPVITALRARMDAISAAELGRLEQRLRHLAPEDLSAVQRSFGSLMNKIFHRPMVQIKNYTAGDDAADKLAVVCELFGLSSDAQVADDELPKGG